MDIPYGESEFVLLMELAGNHKQIYYFCIYHMMSRLGVEKRHAKNL